MPLSRQNITVASRLMLPTYVVLATYFGLLYIVDPQGRLQRSPGLALARDLMPMRYWGVCFLVVAGQMVFALAARRRTTYIFALYVYMVGAVIWAAIYFGATFISPDASFGGPAWPLFVAVACRASARSLLSREV